MVQLKFYISSYFLFKISYYSMNISLFICYYIYRYLCGVLRITSILIMGGLILHWTENISSFVCNLIFCHRLRINREFIIWRTKLHFAAAFLLFSDYFYNVTNIIENDYLMAGDSCERILGPWASCLWFPNTMRFTIFNAIEILLFANSGYFGTINIST